MGHTHICSIDLRPNAISNVFVSLFLSSSRYDSLDDKKAWMEIIQERIDDLKEDAARDGHRASKSECAWANALPPVTLPRVLAHDEAMNVFAQFLESEYSSENIEFWCAVEDYRDIAYERLAATRAYLQESESNGSGRNRNGGNIRHANSTVSVRSAQSIRSTRSGRSGANRSRPPSMVMGSRAKAQLAMPHNKRSFHRRSTGHRDSVGSRHSAKTSRSAATGTQVGSARGGGLGSSGNMLSPADWENEYLGVLGDAIESVARSLALSLTQPKEDTHLHIKAFAQSTSVTVRRSRSTSHPTCTRS